MDDQHMSAHTHIAIVMGALGILDKVEHKDSHLAVAIAQLHATVAVYEALYELFGDGSLYSDRVRGGF